MEAGFVFFIVLLVYVGIGNFVANRYFRRRHGVRGRLGHGWESFDAGWQDAFGVSISWPISMFSDAVRNPELCTHPKHVIAREDARRRSQQVNEALHRENEGRW